MDRRTWDIPVRAEDAAIANKRLESSAAALAVIEELASISRHGFDRLMAALRARKC